MNNTEELIKLDIKEDLGEMLVTEGVSVKMHTDRFFFSFVLYSLSRYLDGDWGDLSEDDKKMNDDAVKRHNNRILAKYVIPGDEIYIITEEDRSVTTILFCSEY